MEALCRAAGVRRCVLSTVRPEEVGLLKPVCVGKHILTALSSCEQRFRSACYLTRVKDTTDGHKPKQTQMVHMKFYYSNKIKIYATRTV